MRRNKWLGVSAVAATLALALSACGSSDDEPKAGEGACKGTIGAMGALSGANASIVQPSIDGAELALDQWLEDHPDCDIKFDPQDSEGDPAKATPIATTFAGNPDVIGVIGGAFSGETRATKTIYNSAGIPMISQSATATDLTQDDPVPVFHRVVPYDDWQGQAIANFLMDNLGATKVFTVDNSEAYGEPLIATVNETLGDNLTGSDKTQVGQTDFAPTVAKIKQADPDAIAYGGYIAEAAPLLKQIRDAGITAPFIGGDGLYGADFGKAVGSAGEGAYVMCPCAPIDESSTFASDFKDKFGAEPGAYAEEGYDAMNVFLAALADGKYDRASINEFIGSYSGQGLSKEISFDENGDVPADKVVYYAYKNTDGVLVPEAEVKLGS